MNNRYPVYVPSRGRFNPHTARFLDEENVPFRIVVDPDEADQYREIWGDHVLVIEKPFSNSGLYQARNFIKQHSITLGAERHWQLDDNIRRTMMNKKK